MEATEQYLPVVIFIILYKLALAFEFADEIVKCDRLNECFWLRCCMLCVQDGSIV